MDKTVAGIIGAVGALVSLDSAQAAPAANPTDVLKAGSYAELLEPIPNATETLQALDAAWIPGQPAEASEGDVVLAQYHHHHHHHHSHYGRYRYAPRVIVVPRFRHHHHHHHHHSHYRARRWSY